MPLSHAQEDFFSIPRIRFPFLFHSSYFPIHQLSFLCPRGFYFLSNSFTPYTFVDAPPPSYAQHLLTHPVTFHLPHLLCSHPIHILPYTLLPHTYPQPYIYSLPTLLSYSTHPLSSSTFTQPTNPISLHPLSLSPLPTHSIQVWHSPHSCHT